jgi:hypothetical protein
MTHVINYDCPNDYYHQLLGSSDGERGYCTKCHRWYELKDLHRRESRDL